jgi:hypothetical protein
VTAWAGLGGAAAGFSGILGRIRSFLGATGLGSAAFKINLGNQIALQQARIAAIEARLRELQSQQANLCS